MREGVDYYVENGKYVFTESYLRARGKCCQSGCMHCPWGFNMYKFEINDEVFVKPLGVSGKIIDRMRKRLYKVLVPDLDTFLFYDETQLERKKEIATPADVYFI